MAYYYSPFRNNYQRKLTDGCAFCDTEKIMHQAVRDKSGRIMENNYYIWLVNFFPKFEGHTLLVPVAKMFWYWLNGNSRGIFNCRINWKSF